MSPGERRRNPWARISLLLALLAVLCSPVIWLLGADLAGFPARAVWQAATVASAPLAVLSVAVGDRSRRLLGGGSRGGVETGVATVMAMLACATYGAELLALR